MARMTPYQIKLVPIDWKREYKVYQEGQEVVEEWLYVKGKDAAIYDPSSGPCCSLRRIHRVEPKEQECVAGNQEWHVHRHGLQVASTAAAQAGPYVRIYVP